MLKVFADLNLIACFPTLYLNFTSTQEKGEKIILRIVGDSGGALGYSTVS